MNELAIQRNDDAAPGSQAVVLRTTAALHDVHSYALGEIAKLENKIASVKHAIELQKNRSQQEVTVYIELVDEALRLSRDMDAAVDRIAAAVAS